MKKGREEFQAEKAEERKPNVVRRGIYYWNAGDFSEEIVVEVMTVKCNEI